VQISTPPTSALRFYQLQSLHNMPRHWPATTHMSRCISEDPNSMPADKKVSLSHDDMREELPRALPYSSLPINFTVPEQIRQMSQYNQERVLWEAFIRPWHPLDRLIKLDISEDGKTPESGECGTDQSLSWENLEHEHRADRVRCALCRFVYFTLPLIKDPYIGHNLTLSLELSTLIRWPCQDVGLKDITFIVTAQLINFGGEPTCFCMVVAFDPQRSRYPYSWRRLTARFTTGWTSEVPWYRILDELIERPMECGPLKIIHPTVHVELPPITIQSHIPQPNGMEGPKIDLSTYSLPQFKPENLDTDSAKTFEAESIFECELKRIVHKRILPYKTTIQKHSRSRNPSKRPHGNNSRSSTTSLRRRLMAYFPS